MATLSQKQQLARDLFGRDGQRGETRVYAPAVASSSGGSIRVNIGGEIVEIPTIGAVRQGQEVVIQVQDGHPVAIGARGWGDGVRDAIADMSDTLSYVWLDDLGQLRITPVPREDDPDTGVMVNANGVNVVGYTYASHTGEDGFSIVMGNSPVLQVLGYAQQPDFQHNVVRSTDFLMLDADSGVVDLSDLSADRTRLIVAEETEAGTYNRGHVLSLDVDGVRVFHVTADGSAELARELYAPTLRAARLSAGNTVSSYYGTCATAAAQQVKDVDCAAFQSADFAAGTLLTVAFSSAQTYNGQPHLTVNGANDYPIVRQGTTGAVRYTWQAGEAVQFVFTGSAWAIVDGGFATTTYYGATKLSSATNSTSTSVAATPSAVKAAYDLAASAGTWRQVICTSGMPSGFDWSLITVYANDTARLLYISFAAENTGGTNTSVPANTNLFTCTDMTLKPTNAIRIGAGFRYNGSALLDFPVRTFSSSSLWALRSPTWAFSAASVHFDATIPYDVLGIA